MKYKYVALNQSQQTLSGIIDGQNEAAAREKLNDLGLSVLNLQPLGKKLAKNTPQDISRYHFEATDQNQKKVVGTIAAKNQLGALDRLTNEYKLNVIKLYAATATPAEQAASQAEVKKLLAELAQIKTQQATNQAQKGQAAQERYAKQVKKQVNTIIDSIHEFLEKYGNQLKPQEHDYINGELAHLEKIKYSNNLENLERSSKKVLQYMQEKELFIEENQNVNARTSVKLETQKLLSELRGLQKDNPDKQIGSLKSQQTFWQQLKEFFFDRAPKVEFPPAIKEQEQLLQHTQKEIWAYLKLYFKSRKKLYKQQSWKAIKNLFRKWWRLRQQISISKAKFHQQHSPKDRQQAINKLINLTGAIAGIYFLIYFIGYFLTIKAFTISWPDFFYVYQTRTLIYLISASLLLHIAIRLKDWFIRKELPFSNSPYIAVSIAFILLIINL